MKIKTDSIPAKLKESRLYPEEKNIIGNTVYNKINPGSVKDHLRNIKNFR